MFGDIAKDRPHQGDIYQKLVISFVNNIGETEQIPFPFCVVVTQECDLDKDFNAWDGKYQDDDKCLKSILMCPAFPAEALKSGLHLTNLSLKMNQWGGEPWKKIKQNKDERFHIIDSGDQAALQPIIIDFKWQFTFPREYVYSMADNKVATLAIPYREQLSHRYANFVSRIALPDELTE